MRGVGPRSTVPIGVFPENRSPTGARDLVGCIWQWCSDPFTGWGPEGGQQSGVSGEEIRHAVRGGAWNTLQWSVTCQSRNGYPCGARFSNLGFRCVADASST
jgi:formylglycine-generating enzyme required for sulfatase activity